MACIGHYNPRIKINVLTRRPHLWSSSIIAHTDKSSWKYKGLLEGKINKASDKPEEVIPGSKILLVAGPSHLHGVILNKIAPFVDKDTWVGTVYGQGAFDLQARSVFGSALTKKNITIFALQNVPFICKIIEYGKSINIIGPKDHLYCASYPPERVHEASNMVSLLYYIPTIVIPNFLCITLTPSNQIIHPGRVYAIFRDWDGKTPTEADKLPRLYDLDEASAYEIQLLDDEIQAIKKAIVKYYPEIDLDLLMPIKERIIKQYSNQISDKSTLKSVFSTNTGYDVLVFPTKQVPGGVLLNTESRFFWEDIPYGLCILKNYGDVFGVPMPNTERLIRWHQQFMGVKLIDEDNNLVNAHLTGAPKKYGYLTRDDLVATSIRKPVPKL